MAKTRLAKIVLTIKGVWSPTVEYEKLDVVNYLGSSYIARRDNIGVTPVEGDDWSLSAEKGGKGDQGDKIYLHIAYANSQDGDTDFTTSPVIDKVYTYLGSYSDYTPEDSTTPSEYRWFKLSEEAARAAAELLRVAAENERVAAETARTSAESNRNTAEETRVSNEQSRVSAETNRVSEESIRKIAEEIRVSDESARKTAETSRVSAENTRDTSETERVSAERERVNAENERNAAEIDRATEFSGYRKEIDEFKTEIVTSKDAATENTRFAIGVAEDSLEVPSMEEFNGLKNAQQEAVLYTPQTLTTDQQAQARENIGAADAITVNELKDDMAGKLTEPDDGLAVGKYFRVAAIDENGHAVLEAVDAKDVGVQDVQVNGASIVADGVAEVPIAGNDGTTFGLVRFNSNSGISVPSSSKIAGVDRASEEGIDAQRKNAAYKRPITPYVLDYAVKAAMCDGKGAAWTADEQAAARERMGIPGEYELIEEITLEEDTSNTTIIRDKDINGDPYDFKAIIVLVKANESTGNGDIRYRVNIDATPYFQLRAVSTNKLNSFVCFDTRDGVWNVYGTYTQDMANVGSTSYSTANYIEKLPLSNITNIKLQVLNNCVLTAGSVIKIFGVRA